MKLRISLIAALISMFLFVPAVFAGTQGSCLPGDLEKVESYENSIGDTSNGNDILWACTQKADLIAISHTLPGGCHALISDQGNWGNCISSVRPYVQLGRSFCIYSLTNYHGVINRYESASNGVRLNLSQNDAALSFRWVPATSAC